MTVYTDLVTCCWEPLSDMEDNDNLAVLKHFKVQYYYWIYFIITLEYFVVFPFPTLNLTSKLFENLPELNCWYLIPYYDF